MLGDYVDYVVSVWTSVRQLCCINSVVILFIAECHCK